MLTVSRRMANAGYIFWTLSHSIVFLYLVHLAYRLHDRDQDDRNTVMSGINFNQFAFFMISNLCTGAVNLSIQTLFVSDVPAFAIIVGYQLAVNLLMYLLWSSKLKLKFW
jgi:phosphatidylinositol glycan class W